MSPGPPQRDDLRAIARRVMRQRGLLPDFEPAVVAEVAALRGPATDGAVKDLRALPWLSVDNDESRDLDQLSVANALDRGRVRLLVAVADVDALVAAGSSADEHARHNTTSVYTPAATFPMLPPRLSTDLTSLNEDADRLAVVVEIVVNADGTLDASDVYRATVRNQAKLAYGSVAAWLDGAAPPRRVAGVIAEQVRLQDRIAQALKALRHEHGALELDTIQPRAVFEDGTLVNLADERPNRAKQLIEDFMVVANGVVARFLAAKGLPSLRRVLRSPERWQRIAELAGEHGRALPPQPDSAALDAFLRERKAADPLRFPDLSLAVVKLLGSGEYALERPGEVAEGHFGLAVHDYTHSTAPNRRFPDLLTQRLLKAALTGARAPYSDEALEALARHCTEQEDSARKVERQMHKSAAALLLGPRIGQRFDAIVTGASAKGTWVRIFDPPVEGKVVRGEQGMDVGARVRVELVHTDVERGYIDFVRANTER